MASVSGLRWGPQHSLRFCPVPQAPSGSPVLPKCQHVASAYLGWPLNPSHLLTLLLSGAHCPSPLCAATSMPCLSCCLCQGCPSASSICPEHMLATPASCFTAPARQGPAAQPGPRHHPPSSPLAGFQDGIGTSKTCWVLTVVQETLCPCPPCVWHIGGGHQSQGH